MNEREIAMEMALAKILAEIDDRLSFADKAKKKDGLLYMDPNSRPENLIGILHQIADENPDYLGIEGGGLLKRVNGHYQFVKRFGETPAIRTHSYVRATSMPLAELKEKREGYIKQGKDMSPVLYRYNGKKAPKFLSEKIIIGLDDKLDYIILLKQKPYFRHHSISESILQHLANLSRTTMTKGTKYQREKIGRNEAEGYLEHPSAILDKLIPKVGEIPHVDYLDTHFYMQPHTRIGKNSNGISGDYMHIEQYGNDLILCIADVKGHGMEAALHAKFINTFLTIQRELVPGLKADEVVSKLNRAYCHELKCLGQDGNFASFFYSKISPDGMMAYSNAGHYPPILMRGEKLKKSGLDEGSPVIGISRSIEYKEGRVRLQKGDTLVYFTDGVIEAEKTRAKKKGSHKEYGLKRLEDSIKRNKGNDAQPLTGCIVDDVHKFCTGNLGRHNFKDDFTIFVVRYNPQ